MHLPSQLKTNELVPSVIQKNIHIFLSAKKEKDIRNVRTSYPFPGVLIVEGSARRKVMSGGKRAEERKSPSSLQSFPGSLYFVPWVQRRFFLACVGELRFVGRRPIRVRLKAEDTSVEAARKTGASGTQGNILRRREISYSYSFSSSNLKVSNTWL